MTNNKKALDTYDARANEITAKLDELVREVQSHRPELDSQVHWGHVGDLGYAVNELEQLIKFFRNEG